MGCRCLAALAEWGKLTKECRKEWRHAEPQVRRDMAGLAAHAAWHMGQWDEMSAYTNEMRTADTSTGSFLTAVQAVHNKNLDAAKGNPFNSSLHPPLFCLHLPCFAATVLQQFCLLIWFWAVHSTTPGIGSLD